MVHNATSNLTSKTSQYFQMLYKNFFTNQCLHVSFNYFILFNYVFLWAHDEQN